MRDAERGTIRNREYAQQLRDFSGLVFGRKSPTDIDCFLDFEGRVFVIVEGKHGDSPLRYGQRLALERLVNACQGGGVETVLLVAEHHGEGDVDYAGLAVRRYYYRGRWAEPREPVAVREAIERFVASRR